MAVAHVRTVLRARTCPAATSAAVPTTWWVTPTTDAADSASRAAHVTPTARTARRATPSQSSVMMPVSSQVSAVGQPSVGESTTDLSASALAGFEETPMSSALLPDLVPTTKNALETSSALVIAVAAHDHSGRRTTSAS